MYSSCYHLSHAARGYQQPDESVVQLLSLMYHGLPCRRYVLYAPQSAPCPHHTLAAIAIPWPARVNHQSSTCTARTGSRDSRTTVHAASPTVADAEAWTAGPSRAQAVPRRAAPTPSGLVTCLGLRYMESSNRGVLNSVVLVDGLTSRFPSVTFCDRHGFHAACGRGSRLVPRAGR